EYPNMFTFSYLFTEGESVDTFGRYVRAQGGTRVAVVRSDLAALATDIGLKLEASLEAVGIEVIAQAFLYNHNLPNADRLGQQIRDSGADVVVGVLSGAEFADVMQGLRTARADIKVALAPSGYDPSLLDRFGQQLAGLSIFLNYVPFEADTDAHRRYLDSMIRYAPELASPDQEIAFVSYIFTDLFLHGLELAGPCPTRQSFINTLRAERSYDADGLLPGPIDFTRDFGQISLCYTFLKVDESGERFRIVDNPDTGPGDPSRWCGDRI
nr:ABC transporter substrate-binding protein [Micromonospora sp. DSM 115978]